MKAMMIAAFCGALLLSAAPAIAQESNCDAYANAELETNEQGEITQLEFSVEVSSSENCAKIEYDLVLDELMPNGQTKKERLPRYVQLADGGYYEVVEHKIPASFQLTSHEAKIVSCVRCTIMP
jgi:hypothetical protein